MTPFLVAILCVFTFVSVRADDSATRRDIAYRRIGECLRRNEVSSRQCKHLNEDVDALVSIYKAGDRTTLPTLLKFTYLTQFYDETLIADPESFLSAVSQLPKENQHAVEDGLVGGMIGLRRPQFDALRAALRTVPESSANFKLAQESLETVESKNASYLVDYFPPQTFHDDREQFRVHWFSNALYALQQKPLWSAATSESVVYRLTVLPAFVPVKTLTLTIFPDKTGEIRAWTFERRQKSTKPIETIKTVSAYEIAQIRGQLDALQFWQMDLDSRRMGFDGAEFILEGKKGSDYHVVVRWCPEKGAFDQTTRALLKLAGLNPEGC